MLVGRMEYFLQSGLFSAYSRVSISRKNYHIACDKIGVAAHNEQPQTEKKSADIHRISHMRIWAGYREVLILMKLRACPHLNQLS